MNKGIILFMAICSLFMVSCNDMRGYKQTEDGVYYRFVQQDPNAQQANVGDVLEGKLTVRLDDNIAVNAEVGIIEDILHKLPWYNNELHNALEIMHRGDCVVYAIDADNLSNLNFYFPTSYKKGSGMKMYFDIELQNIMTKEEAARLEQARIEQERIEQERAKNLIITPPISVSDLRNRIIGTKWTVEHRDSEGIYPIFEFDGSMVYEYSVWKGKKELRNKNPYTIREDFESDCYLIEFGDNYDIGNLKKIFIFVNETNKVVLYEPTTNSKDNLQLIY